MTIRRTLPFVLVLLLSLAGCPRPPRTLSTDQAAALEAAVASLKAIGGAVGGMFPTADLQGFVDSFEDQLPTCPAVEFTAGDDSIEFTLDFGETCAPRLFPNVTFGGTLSGNVQFVGRQILLTLNGFRVNDLMVTGTVSVGFVRQDDLLSLEGAFDLTLDATGSFNGNVNVQIDRSTGVVTVLFATVSLVDATGNQINVEADDLVIEPQANGNFIPGSGVAIVTVDPVAEDEGEFVINVEFTSESPTDGTITVSVGDSPALTYTLDEG